MDTVKPEQTSIKWITRILGLLVILTICFSSMPLTTYAADSENTCRLTYIVAKGDTLNSIARIFTVKFDDLVSVNDLKEPYRVFVGQQLCIPKLSKIGPVGATGTIGAAEAMTLSIVHTPQGFVLTGSNFPEKSNYVIKVDDLATSEVKWVTLGPYKIKDGGTGIAEFSLPKELQKANFMFICLKNQRTDELFCKYSVRYVPQS